MMAFAVVLSLAVAGIALSSNFSPASASKMNGKCCQSSDGGRSYRYRMAMQRAAIPRGTKRCGRFGNGEASSGGAR